MGTLEIARHLASAGQLPSGGRVLDVGAGTGRVAIAFAALGYETVAVDSSLPMLNELRRKAPDKARRFRQVSRLARDSIGLTTSAE